MGKWRDMGAGTGHGPQTSRQAGRQNLTIIMGNISLQFTEENDQTQRYSYIVRAAVLMFPAQIRGQDVKLTVNLIVNLSPLTSGSCQTITETLASSSDLRLHPFLPAPVSHHCWCPHARAQFRKTNETEKPQTFPISLAVRFRSKILTIKYWEPAVAPQ